jgi:hypothetical protein
VIEDQVVRDPAGELVGEAGFALLYFQRATDLIPDSIPGMGLLDDAMIVHIVLGCHEPAFRFIPDGDKLSCPAPSFDIDQLLSVVSPLRLTWFYLSMLVLSTLSINATLGKELAPDLSVSMRNVKGCGAIHAGNCSQEPMVRRDSEPVALPRRLYQGKILCPANPNRFRLIS